MDLDSPSVVFVADNIDLHTDCTVPSSYAAVAADETSYAAADDDETSSADHACFSLGQGYSTWRKGRVN